MLIVDAPPLPPGECLITKTSEGPFIDTMIDFDDLSPFGRLYLSRDAIMSMAQMFGATPPETSVRREARIDDLERRLNQALTDLAGVTAANEALVAAGYQARTQSDSIEAQVPGGSVAKIVEWINAGGPGDRTARAAAALAVERAEAGRPTLIDACEKILKAQEVPA